MSCLQGLLYSFSVSHDSLNAVPCMPFTIHLVPYSYVHTYMQCKLQYIWSQSEYIYNEIIYFREVMEALTDKCSVYIV